MPAREGEFDSRALFRTGSVTLVLKALTVASKFFVLIYVGRELSLEALGNYGLLTVSVAMAVQFLGLDFYIVNTRSILGGELAHQAGRVRDQAVLHGVVYLLALPLFAGALFFEIAATESVVWLLVLGLAEHVSQEQSRLLTALRRPVMGSIILFIRLGAWGTVLALAYVGLGWTPSLRVVLALWVGGAALSIVVGSRALADMRLLSYLGHAPDWKWIREGLIRARPFWIGTLSLKTIELSDRWFLEHYRGLEDVGIYTFFQSIAGLTSTVVVTSIVMILGPRIVAAHLANDRSEEARISRLFAGGVTAVSLGLILILLVGIGPLVMLLGRPEVDSHRAVFLILLGGAALSNMATLPYYRLYARSLDVTIMVASVIGAAVNVALNVVLVPSHGLMGAAWATVLGFACYAGVLAAGWVTVRSHEPDGRA